MSILIDQSTRVLVQGITGAQGTRDTKHCLDYGTRIVVRLANLVPKCLEIPSRRLCSWVSTTPLFSDALGESHRGVPKSSFDL